MTVKPAEYNPKQIESYWSEKWERDGLYRSRVDWSKPKHYALTMLPYPSGDLHIGHWFAMTPSDARARYMRMKGYNVLFPMGFDAFGLPAENAAVQRNVHPWKWTYSNIERMRKQLRSMGAMFDWEREVVSCDPSYYKWTEWFFKVFFDNGLAYRGEAMVNWSPTLQTVLANEQVIDGKDERTGQPVIQKLMTQWFFNITRYADELLDYSSLDWPETVINMQKNWIGRSEGAQVTFKTEHGDAIEIFTTRPDTLWGATFMVLAPEHPLVEKVTSEGQKAAVETYKAQVARLTEIDRTAEDREKTGMFTGGYAINPVNNERIPIWIADYVLITYGSGAIMAVPAHDQRDFEFARKFNLPIRVVIQPEGETLNPDTMPEAHSHEGIMVNSGPFNGTPATNDKGRKNPAINAVIDWLEVQGIGKEAVNYRLRDWLISRQRYWGAPIPIVYGEDGTVESVPEEDLPVLLPEDVEFMPTGQSPLMFHQGFLNTKTRDGKPARRETDTMDTFMCSSWYQLRYLSPNYDHAPFDPEEAAYWLPVDVYTGGVEHATMHLLYTREFTKALRDFGVYDATAEAMRRHGRNPEGQFDEPMLVLRNQGQILGEARPGHFVMASGHFEGEKLFANKVKVVDRNAPVPANFDGVAGEIIRRTERILTVDVSTTVDEKLVTVEVLDGAEIDIPEIEGQNNVNQLKHRLDIQRMSKSKGNVVNPDELVAKYGADTVRAYLMFAFKFEKGGPWDSQGIQGVIRWINDVWEIVTTGAPEGSRPDEKANRDLLRKTHQTIARVTDGLEKFSFNTAVAALMELKNLMQASVRAQSISPEVWHESVKNMLLLMAPFTPFLAEALWEHIGEPYSVHTQAWPVYNAEIAAEDEVTLVVQINGKVRDRIQVPASITEEEAKATALASERVREFLNGGQPKKVIYIAKGNMVSIVI
ncbi:MAG: leucine--tRNA ligase [Anaerolineae bacterium]|nr:MAG: leucine--tRNA ligase [Anaerolineae bacterium]